MLVSKKVSCIQRYIIPEMTGKWTLMIHNMTNGGIFLWSQFVQETDNATVCLGKFVLACSCSLHQRE